MTYAGKVESGFTVQAIVGTAEWAIQNIGGEWHDSEEKIPVPGVWDDAYGFRPMPPAWDCRWENNQWICPSLMNSEIIG